ncbi:MAG: hypothetical protein DME91_03560 [Verrucomicrobia bacterium]|nr:MAG: hypothetical protein DME91_03560 [Verrucomicrobiota bacterium]PYJ48823.1 MAG: hypothetical protein DME85_01890 [Verrucomicrobiota bacterium]
MFGVEKPIDDDGITLSRVPPRRAHSFATDDIRPAVDGYTCRVGKDNFADIGNFCLDRRRNARCGTGPVPRCVLARTDTNFLGKSVEFPHDRQTIASCNTLVVI